MLNALFQAAYSVALRAAPHVCSLLPLLRTQTSSLTRLILIMQHTNGAIIIYVSKLLLCTAEEQ
jgi:hypothetical protein